VRSPPAGTAKPLNPVLCVMPSDLLIVTGAPGSGKSSTASALVQLGSPYAIFDIDWLADAAGELAGRSIYSDSTTWGPYRRLWHEILCSVARNDIQPIFFCPNTPSDLEGLGKAEWCNSISWLLLDCDERTRRERLDVRSDWSAERKMEAMKDARELRRLIDQTLDTSLLLPGEVARKVLGWAESSCGGS